MTYEYQDEDVSYISNTYFNKTVTKTVRVYEAYKSEGTGRKTNGKYVEPVAYEATYRHNQRGFSVEPIVVNGKPYLQRALTAFGTPPSSCYGNVSKNNLINKAIGDAGQQKMLLGETIGGAKESFNMITKRSRQLYNAIRAIRRLDFAQAASILGHPGKGPSKSNSAASAFLELQFGWLPLLDDIYTATDLISNGVNTSLEDGYVVGRSGATSSGSGEGEHSQTSHRVLYTGESGAHVKMVFGFRHPCKGRTLNQLGILNPASIAWDLSAMSFVADWIFPVSDFLNAFSAKAGLSYKYGYYSVLKRAESTGVVFDSSINPTTKWVFEQLPYRESIVTERELVTDVPRLPDFQLPNSLSQAAIAAALITQRYT